MKILVGILSLAFLIGCGDKDKDTGDTSGETPVADTGLQGD
jgi:hypothetical protein